MLNVKKEVRFLDIDDLETKAHNELVNIQDRLKNVQKNKRSLTTAEKQQLDLCEAILARDGKGDVCDPLFVATRELLNTKKLLSPELITHHKGRLEFDESGFDAVAKAKVAPAKPHPGNLNGPIMLTSLVLGILIIDGATPPPVTISDSRNVPDDKNKLMQAFTRQFFAAVGEANSYGRLAVQVLALMCVEGDPDGSGGEAPRVVTAEFARVMRGLAARKVQADEPQLRRRVNEQLNAVQNVGGEDGIADLGIDLPDLENIEDANIVADNVRVMGPMIVSAMFDELKVFQVVDNIVEQFQHGTLAIGPGNAGKLLYQYWRETPNRLSEQERKNFSAITLGVPGGDPGVAVNREFNDLWIRFVSAVSSFVRQSQVDALLRASVPNPINHQQVRKAARDLAGNLSLHGYGMAHYAAREIQYQVKFMIDLLQDSEIRGCFGAKDMWQVIDQVATYNLGGAKTSSRYRTLATCGTIITAWLSDNVTRINKATGPLLDIDQIANPDVSANHKATVHPTDYDLVNACELWLADTSTTDAQIEQFSQPREAPQMTSKPVPMPAMAREMLDGIGDIGGGIGVGMGTPIQSGYGFAKPRH